MYIVEKTKGKRHAKKLDNCLQISKSTKNLMVLDNNGKKIIKGIDAETFKMKFG